MAEKDDKEKRKYEIRGGRAPTAREQMASVSGPDNWDQLLGNPSQMQSTPDPVVQTRSDEAIARVFNGSVRQQDGKPILSEKDQRLTEAILNGTFAPLPPKLPKKRPRMIPPKPSE